MYNITLCIFYSLRSLYSLTQKTHKENPNDSTYLVFLSKLYVWGFYSHEIYLVFLNLEWFVDEDKKCK